MRQNGFSLKARQSVTLDGFLGVDYSSSPMRVSRSRATDLQNLIIEDGIVRKRHGWREILKLSSEKINGIYDFSRAGVYIVHAGCDIYAVKKDNSGYDNLDPNAEFGITDVPSYFYYYDDALYILCGNLLVCNYDKDSKTCSLKAAIGENSAAYIPATTISINAQGDGDGKSEFFESANLLTPYRKNMLLATGCLSEWIRYALDGEIDFQKKVKIAFETILDLDTPNLSAKAECEVEITFEQNEAAVSCKQIGGFSDRVLGKEVSGVVFTDNEISAKIHLYDVNTGMGCYFEIRLPRNTFLSESYIELRGGPFYGKKAKDICVTFAAVGADQAERIKKCRFGTLFGADGNSNRLFLSGNPDEPNVDFYSEQDNFLYFPSGNVSYFGTDSVPITGYGRLSDNSMAVYKADNPNEPTIYYRTGTDNYVYDASGNLSEIQTVFKVAAGAIGEGNASPRACTNFAGDNLIISKNGIFGIVTAENLATNEKYAKPRSVAINPRLTRCDLTKAISFVHKNRLYVSVGDECYVADSAYKYVPTGTLDGAFSYEWWRWTNIPAACFCEVDGELYFGTADGRICKFYEKYSDRFTYATVEGEISVSGGAIICNEEIFENGFIKVGERIDSISGIYKVNDGVKTLLSDNDEIYITEADEEKCRFRLGCIADDGYESYCLERSDDAEPRLTLERRVPYLAYWVTPFMDMGTNVQGKTLERLTISVEPECDGKLTFGYETRVNKRDISARGLNGFSFDTFDFCDFHFRTDFASSFTARVRERNFNYIRLRYASSDESALGVNNITLTFKRGSENKGLR